MCQYNDNDVKNHIASVHKVAQQSAKLIQTRKEGSKREFSNKWHIESRFHNYHE